MTDTIVTRKIAEKEKELFQSLMDHIGAGGQCCLAVGTYHGESCVILAATDQDAAGNRRVIPLAILIDDPGDLTDASGRSPEQLSHGSPAASAESPATE